MANKRYLIHWLLALCIGLLPTLNAGAMSLDNPAPVPMDCLDCGMVGMNHDNACQDQNCTSIYHSCQAHSGANFLPVAAVFESASTRQMGNPDRSDAASLQDMTDPIYRPPIA